MPLVQSTASVIEVPTAVPAEMICSTRDVFYTFLQCANVACSFFVSREIALPSVESGLLIVPLVPAADVD